MSLNDEAARDQAAQKKRNEVLVSFMPQSRDSRRRDSVAAAMPERPAKAAGDSARSQAGARRRRWRPWRRRRRTDAAGPKGPFTPAQIQAAIDSGRVVMLNAAVAKGPVTEVVDTINGGVAGYAGSVGSIGGMTALHHAVRQGNVNAVLALLDGGANINDAEPTDHTTPLLLATINGQFDVAMQADRARRRSEHREHRRRDAALCGAQHASGLRGRASRSRRPSRTRRRPISR